MFNGGKEADLALQPGDVIFVSKSSGDFSNQNPGKQADSSGMVRVFGSVKSPGLIRFKSDDDVLSLIAKSGGFDSTANKTFVLRARANNDGTVTTEKIDVGSMLKDEGEKTRAKVLPGDIIIVRSSNKSTSSRPGNIRTQDSAVPVGDFGTEPQGVPIRN
jgi:protein involved in polysaccharide export with SLBB domain